MEERLIDLVAELIKTSRSVPLPGGHGVRFPEIREGLPAPPAPFCALYRAAPGDEVRAYVCLALLGKRATARARQAAPHATSQSYFGPGGEKWNGSQWLIYATDWFEQRSVDLKRQGRTEDVDRLEPIEKPHRWRYLLHALERLAASCAGLTRVQLDFVRNEWLSWGESRLEGLLYKWKGHIVPPLLLPRLGIVLTAADPQWKTADALLSGEHPDAALVQALYFMHVLHARAGVWQVDPDDDSAYGSRKDFYLHLLELLRHSDACTCHRDTASSVAGALERLGLFSNSRTDVAGRLTPELPSCFSPYKGAAVPHLADTTSLVDNPTSKRRLEEAHHLAAVVADLLLDPLHVRPRSSAAPGFTVDDYTFLESRTRHRQRTLRNDAELNIDPESHEQQFRRDMAKYYNQMNEGRIFELVQLHLPDVHRAMWSTAAAQSNGCALCHVDTGERLT